MAASTACAFARTSKPAPRPVPKRQPSTPRLLTSRAVLEHLNAYVCLMVGLATLIYLCLRIRREIRDRNAKPALED